MKSNEELYELMLEMKTTIVQMNAFLKSHVEMDEYRFKQAETDLKKLQDTNIDFEASRNQQIGRRGFIHNAFIVVVAIIPTAVYAMARAFFSGHVK